MMKTERLEVTLTLKVTPYQAALLMCAYELMRTPYERLDDMSPQTFDNYTTLLSELFDTDTRQRILDIAEGSMGEDTADKMRNFLSTYFK
jgi:hypothetical protein